MILFNLKDIVETAGVNRIVSGDYNVTTNDSGNSVQSQSNQTAQLLSNNVIRDNVSNKISKAYTKGLSELLINVNDSNLSTSITEKFRTYLETKDSAPEPHPAYDNRDYSQNDALYTLLKSLSSLSDDYNIRSKVYENPTPAGASFAFNMGNFLFELDNREIALIDELGLEALESIDAIPDIANNTNGIFITDESYRNNFKNSQFPTYTAVDISILFMTPYTFSDMIAVKTMTYSTHSGKIPVSTLGRDSTKGFSKGKRTIAGTIIATLTVNDPLFSLQPVIYGVDDYAKTSNDIWRTYLLPDQLPLFDALILFRNEYGFNSAVPIFGISITDNGTVLSSSDSEIEVQYTYTAIDIDVVRSINGTKSDDGDIRSFNILENNEYIAKRKLAYEGHSAHRSITDIPALYAGVDRRARELQYNELRRKGYDLSDIINATNVLRN